MNEEREAYDSFYIEEMFKVYTNYQKPDYRFALLRDEHTAAAILAVVEKDEWHADLLSHELFWYLENVLTPREFFVLEEKIAGKSDAEIALELRPKNSTNHYYVSPIKSAIKAKLENRIKRELPGWVRGKIWEKNKMKEAA